MGDGSIDLALGTLEHCVPIIEKWRMHAIRVRQGTLVKHQVEPLAQVRSRCPHVQQIPRRDKESRVGATLQSLHLA